MISCDGNRREILSVKNATDELFFIPEHEIQDASFEHSLELPPGDYVVEIYLYHLKIMDRPDEVGDALPPTGVVQVSYGKRIVIE